MLSSIPRVYIFGRYRTTYVAPERWRMGAVYWSLSVDHIYAVNLLYFQGERSRNIKRNRRRKRTKNRRMNKRRHVRRYRRRDKRGNMRRNIRRNGRRNRTRNIKKIGRDSCGLLVTYAHSWGHECMTSYHIDLSRYWHRQTYIPINKTNTLLPHAPSPSPFPARTYLSLKYAQLPAAPTVFCTDACLGAVGGIWVQNVRVWNMWFHRPLLR